MNGVADDDDRKCILQGSSGKAEQIRQTNYHAGNSICNQRNTFYRIFQFLIYRTSCSDQCTAVCH